MNRKIDSYEGAPLRRHESTMQELRHERKTESLRLDGLKKVLQTKMHLDPARNQQVRAA